MANRPKIYCYRNDRSEFAMIDPVIRRLKVRKWLTRDWRKADFVIIPGDRREAIRFALNMFERGTPIWHLGSGDMCEGDEWHYDGLYRQFISLMASRTGGKRLALHYGQAAFSEDTIIVGPTMISDLPDLGPRPIKESYNLYCYNPLPNSKQIDHQEMQELNSGFRSDRLAIVTPPGNDGNPEYTTSLMMRHNRLMRLVKMPNRAMFLTYMKHASEVYGNSSALCYEAPLFHEDKHIHMVGCRNKGRQLVRWNPKKDGDPANNVIKAIETSGYV